MAVRARAAKSKKCAVCRKPAKRLIRKVCMKCYMAATRAIKRGDVTEGEAVELGMLSAPTKSGRPRSQWSSVLERRREQQRKSTTRSKAR